ncbi:MAG TPA: hypothetical protein VFN31_01080 [Candidatus Saccharimonadales bacterium]|nr:hypothetical protein [Candidatus Saccharimonadales bacterium]
MQPVRHESPSIRVPTVFIVVSTFSPDMRPACGAIRLHTPPMRVHGQATDKDFFGTDAEVSDK